MADWVKCTMPTGPVHVNFDLVITVSNNPNGNGSVLLLTTGGEIQIEEDADAIVRLAQSIAR